MKTSLRARNIARNAMSSSIAGLSSIARNILLSHADYPRAQESIGSGSSPIPRNGEGSAMTVRSRFLPPSEDVREADQAVEQRPQDERRALMRIIAIPRFLHVRRHRVVADSENARYFPVGFAARGPQYA